MLHYTKFPAKNMARYSLTHINFSKLYPRHLTLTEKCSFKKNCTRIAAQDMHLYDTYGPKMGVLPRWVYWPKIFWVLITINNLDKPVSKQSIKGGNFEWVDGGAFPIFPRLIY